MQDDRHTDREPDGGLAEVVLIRAPDGRIVARVALPRDGRALLIGRGAGADVVIDHAQVSRRHAELSHDGPGRYRIRDLQSRNGTFVDERPVSEEWLGPGDRVRIGEHTLVFGGHAGEGSDLPPANGTIRFATESDPVAVRTLQDLSPPSLSAAHLTGVTELSRRLLATADPVARAGELCTTLVGPALRGLSAVVLRATPAMPDEPPLPLCAPVLATDVAVPAAHGRGPLTYVSRGVVRAVCDRRAGVLASNVAGRDSGGAGGGAGSIELSIVASELRATAVACPLREEGDTIDLVYALFPPECGLPEWLALVSLAAEQFRQAEAAWAARARAVAQAAIERDLEHAREIQLRLVPGEQRLARLRAADVDVAIGFVPSLRVGGDYADVLEMPDGRILVTVADVAGKGMPAALIASSIRSMIHMGAAAGLGLPELLARLNDQLHQALANGEFATIVAIAVDPRSGEAECLNLGHLPALLVSPFGGVRRLQHAEFAPLGIEADPLRGELTRLARGEFLVLYSDGLTELRGEDERMWGIDGLEATLAAACRQATDACAAVAESVWRAMDAHRRGRPAGDDCSFVVLKLAVANPAPQQP